MNQAIKLFIGIFGLLLAYPIGILLRKTTKDELKQGKKYFFIITLFGLFFGLVGLIIRKDWLLFTSFFFAIIAFQSIKD